MAEGDLDDSDSLDMDVAETDSIHSVDQAALVWQHMRQDSGLSDEGDSLYDETGLCGPPWL
jgi:hypothetical protein